MLTETLIGLDKDKLTIDQWHAWTIRTAFADTLEVSVEEFITTDLETFLDDLGSILIHAVFCGEAEDVIDGTVAISRGAMLADMLNAPVPELTMSDDIDTSENFGDARTLLAHVSKDLQQTTLTTYLILFQAVFEDVLDDKTTSLTQSDLVPHASECFIDITHDLRR
jgi:hypothetical protein